VQEGGGLLAYRVGGRWRGSGLLALGPRAALRAAGCAFVRSNRADVALDAVRFGQAAAYDDVPAPRGAAAAPRRLASMTTKGEVQKVAFTMYPVEDPKRARRFYEEVLGLTVGSHSDSGVWTEYDLPGGGCLALFKTNDIKPSSNSGGSVALEVDDLDAIVARLETQGVKFAAKLVPSPVCRMSVILDTEGNSVILHELKHKKK
jgi:predicted enzyme related to lactoylglutathione lyase